MAQPDPAFRFAGGLSRLGFADLSDGFWKTRFGGNPAVIGQSITLGGVRFKIVGVLPAKFRTRGFRYEATPDAFGPLGYDASQPFARDAVCGKPDRPLGFGIGRRHPGHGRDSGDVAPGESGCAG
jgi:hypothetical protein